MAQDNQPISNLPEFKADAGFAPADRSGEWVRAPGSLKLLGQSLKVDTDRPAESAATIIRAIPDPWAQAKTFAEAVLDDKHSMHAAALSQWRGLLALFALADLRKDDYSIDVQRVVLGDNHPFDRVLKHLAPQLAIKSEAALWLTPYIVYLQPKNGRVSPVALLNPASLVSPGRTTWQLPFDFIPWMSNGLSDPLSLAGAESLANSQLAALEAYLRNLRDSLPRVTDSTAVTLREQVQRFLAEVQDRKGASPRQATVRRATDPTLPSLYRDLVLPAELEEPEDPAAQSQTRVRLATEEESSLGELKGVILVDEGIANTLKQDARDVIVWGNQSLTELRSPNALQEAQRQGAERGWLIITPDDLFTERLVKLGKEPRIPGHSPDLRASLEPIRPIVLLFDQSGTRRLQVDGGTMRAAATLHLKLDGEDGSAIAHAITRTYRQEETTAARLIDEVDWDFGQASIWPDFRSKNWNQYYARFTYPTTREQIRPQFALSRGIIAAALEEAETGGHAVQTIQAINSGKAPGERADWFRRFQNVAGKAYEELQVSDRPFEAVFYVDYHPDRGEAAAGCVRLSLTDIKDRDNRGAVAVDFGSTNSVACFSGTGGEAITLRGRIVHPILFQDSSHNDEWQHIVRWSYVDFLPLADRQTPTPTVVISRNDADRNADLWLHRHLIYFQPVGSHAKQGAAQEIEKLESFLKRSEFDLKWNEDVAHIDASADFLEQFMTMIAAEATAGEYNPRLLEWHFSVPDAMQGSRLQSFRSQVETAREKLSPQGRLHDLYSEGLAAARFILSGREGSKFIQGTINAILDIGGSTTDITLWARDKLIWKGSFRLAGRAFFTECIVQNPEILREIELSDWADLIDPDKPARLPQESVADVGELLFSRPALSEAFDKHWNRRLSLKPGEGLRSTALVFCSGIAYYLGLVASALVQEGVLEDSDLDRPAFALCGRGAGIFDRMHGGQSPDADTPVTSALRTFATGLGRDRIARPQLFISRKPKLEVAAGMMVNFDTINARVGNGVPRSTFTPAGLPVEFVDREHLAATDPLDAVIESPGSRGSDLSTLLMFLEALEAFTGVSIDLRQGAGQGAFNEVNNAVRQKIDRLKDENGQIRLVEPPFITALGGLVAILAGPQSERDGRLALEVA
ncbi:MAG TPA: hypothetical protein VGF77_09195 [Allosphingosinicella sp.]|jgi:hypothetical protein